MTSTTTEALDGFLAAPGPEVVPEPEHLEHYAGAAAAAADPADLAEALGVEAAYAFLTFAQHDHTDPRRTAVVAELDAQPRRPLLERLVRPVLALLALSAVQIGLWILVAPRSFYDDFPGLGRAWVSVDGPYNEHLLRDFGNGQLVLAAILVAAFLRPERYLVRVAALAELLFAVPHLAYHATHLDVYDTGDKVANMVLLGVAVLLPAVLVLGSAPRSGRAGTVAPWVPSGSSSPPSSAPSPV